MGERKEHLKCWSQRLCWVFGLVGMVLGYFVLRNFAMNFWMFVVTMGSFTLGGYYLGVWLGNWLDVNHRTESGLLRQELRLARSMLRWLQRIHVKSEGRLSEEVRDKLQAGIGQLKETTQSSELKRSDLVEQRQKLERFADDQLGAFKKGVVREYVESIGAAVVIALFLRAFVIEAFQIPSGSMIPSLRVGDHIFVNKLSYGVRIPLLPLRIGDHKIPALAWNWTMPERGDVIVFIEPENEEEDYIKRVVAVGGDKVEVKDGQVFINDQPYPLKDDGDFEYEDLDEDGNPRGWRVSTRRFTETIGEVQHPILRKSCTSHRDCIRLGTDCDHPNRVCHQESFGPYRVPEHHVFVMGDNRDNSRDSRVWKSVPMELIKGRAEFIWWSYRQDLVQWERMFTAIR